MRSRARSRRVAMRNRYFPPSRPGSAQEVRSQLALELLLNAYAVCGALIFFRTLLRTLGVDSHLWVGSAIYGVTDIMAYPFGFIPGADTPLAGDLTLTDLTLLAGVVLFPLALLVFGNRR